MVQEGVIKPWETELKIRYLGRCPHRFNQSQWASLKLPQEGAPAKTVSRRQDMAAGVLGLVSAEFLGRPDWGL